MKTTDPPIIVQIQLNVPPKEIWKAITSKDQMIQWFFENIPDFKAEVGFTTRFNVQTENHTFPHLWKITTVIPEQKIIYDWQYEGYRGLAKVTFELLPIQEQTTLKVTSEVIEDFEDNIVEFERDSCLTGWKYFIEDRLFNFFNHH